MQRGRERQSSTRETGGGNRGESRKVGQLILGMRPGPDVYMDMHYLVMKHGSRTLIHALGIGFLNIAGGKIKGLLG